MKFFNQRSTGRKKFLQVPAGLLLFSLFHLIASPAILSLFNLQWRSHVNTAVILMMGVSMILLILGIGCRKFTSIRGRHSRIIVNILLAFLLYLLCCSAYIISMLTLSFTMKSEEILEYQGEKYVWITADLGGDQNELHRYYGPFVMSRTWIPGPGEEEKTAKIK